MRLQDINDLGLCALEIMIGKTTYTRHSLTIEDLPMTWAEFPESTPLIQSIVECMSFYALHTSEEKLQRLRDLLLDEYDDLFVPAPLLLTFPQSGEESAKDGLPLKKAVIRFLNRERKEAEDIYAALHEGAEGTATPGYSSGDLIVNA